MEKKYLTEREYLGTGYVHNFINENGEIKTIQTSKSEYENSSIPSFEGCTYLNSQGGAVMVVSPNVVLQENEYTKAGEVYYVCTKSEFGLKVTNSSEEEFNNIWQ